MQYSIAENITILKVSVILEFDICSYHSAVEKRHDGREWLRHDGGKRLRSRPSSDVRSDALRTFHDRQRRVVCIEPRLAMRRSDADPASDRQRRRGDGGHADRASVRRRPRPVRASVRVRARRLHEAVVGGEDAPACPPRRRGRLSLCRSPLALRRLQPAAGGRDGRLEPRAAPGRRRLVQPTDGRRARHRRHHRLLSPRLVTRQRALPLSRHAQG